MLDVITDRKIAVPAGTIPNQTIASYTANVTSYSDYYAFGMQLPGRNGSDAGYRYGFQGQEKDDEIKGEGNSINFEFRMHDPRIGRFFAVDPLARKYPFWSPYVFSGNQVICVAELEGLEPGQNLNLQEHELEDAIINPPIQGKAGDGIGGTRSAGIISGFSPGMQAMTFAEVVNGTYIDGATKGRKLDDGYVFQVAICKDSDLGIAIITRLESEHGIKFKDLSRKEKKSLLTVNWQNVINGDAFGAEKVQDRSDLFWYRSSSVMQAQIAVPVPVPVATSIPVVILPGDGIPNETVYVDISILGKEMADQFARTSGKKKITSADSEYNQEAEHTSNARPSTKKKHQKGEERKGRDKGGEKGDKRRTRYK